VPADKLWGAQTQRSLQNFDISGEQQPREIIKALAQVKRSSAVVNHALGLQDEKKTQAIVAAADEVIAGKHAGEFPLVVWQTGSGTQTNMNVNEVLANRASEILGGERGEGPAGAPQRRRQPQPVVQRRLPDRHARGRGGGHDAQAAAGHCQAARHAGKEGQRLRRHREDRPHPPAGRHAAHLGQEFSGYVAQLDARRSARARRLPHLCELALGGTAVGTGLNAPKGYAEQVAAELARSPACRS
jgi:fumarate hydratase class II